MKNTLLSSRTAATGTLALAVASIALLGACGAGKQSEPGKAPPTNGGEPRELPPPAAGTAPADPQTGCALLTKDEVGQAFGVTVTAVEGSVSVSGKTFYCSYRAGQSGGALNTIYSPVDPSGFNAANAGMHTPVTGVGDAASYDEKQGVVWVASKGKGFSVFGKLDDRADPKEALVAAARSAAARL